MQFLPRQSDKAWNFFCGSPVKFLPQSATQAMSLQPPMHMATLPQPLKSRAHPPASPLHLVAEQVSTFCRVPPPLLPLQSLGQVSAVSKTAVQVPSPQTGAAQSLGQMYGFSKGSSHLPSPHVPVAVAVQSPGQVRTVSQGLAH